MDEAVVMGALGAASTVIGVGLGAGFLRRRTATKTKTPADELVDRVLAPIGAETARCIGLGIEPPSPEENLLKYGGFCGDRPDRERLLTQYTHDITRAARRQYDFAALKLSMKYDQLRAESAALRSLLNQGPPLDPPPSWAAHVANIDIIRERIVATTAERAAASSRRLELEAAASDATVCEKLHIAALGNLADKRKPLEDLRGTQVAWALAWSAADAAIIAGSLIAWGGVTSPIAMLPHVGAALGGAAFLTITACAMLGSRMHPTTTTEKSVTRWKALASNRSWVPFAAGVAHVAGSLYLGVFRDALFVKTTNIDLPSLIGLSICSSGCALAAAVVHKRSQETQVRIEALEQQQDAPEACRLEARARAAHFRNLIKLTDDLIKEIGDDLAMLERASKALASQEQDHQAAMRSKHESDTTHSMSRIDAMTAQLEALIDEISTGFVRTQHPYMHAFAELFFRPLDPEPATEEASKRNPVGPTAPMPSALVIHSNGKGHY